MKSESYTVMKKTLLSFLIFAFVFSSISGVVFMYGKYNIIKTSKKSININEYIKFLNRERENFYHKNVQANLQFDMSLLNSKTFMQYALDKMTTMMLINFETHEYNTEVSEEIIIQRLLQDESLLTNNEFDNFKFKKLLDKLNLTEKDLIKLLKQELGEKFLMSLFIESIVTNAYISNQLFNYKNLEKKVILYSKNINEFNFDGIAITEEEEKDYYNKNINKFLVSEKRNIDYIEFETLSEEEQNKIKDALLISENIEELAKKFKKTVKTFNFKTKEEASKIEEHNLFELFSYKLNEFTQLKNINNKFYIYSVVDIKPEYVKDFNTVKEEIKNNIKQDKKVQIAKAEMSKYAKEYKDHKMNNVIFKKHNLKEENLSISQKNEVFEEKLIKEIFNLNIGEITTVYNDNKRVYFIVLIKNSTLDKIHQDFVSHDYVKNDLSNSMFESIKSSYEKYLKDFYKTKVKYKLLELLVSSEEK